GEDFDFIIYHSSNENGPWRPLDLTGIFVGDAGEPTDAVNGAFRLSSSDVALIELVPGPDSYYMVIETDSRGLTPAYSLMRAYRNDAGGYSTEAIFSTTDSYLKDHPGVSETAAIPASPGDIYYLLFSNTSVSTHDLTIGKAVAGGASAGDGEKLFAFELTYLGDVLGLPVPWQTPWTVPLTLDENETGAVLVGLLDGVLSEERITDGSGGRATILLLKDGETALIQGLPAGQYRIAESPESGFNIAYTIDAGSAALSADGKTAPFPLLSDTAVVYTNTLIWYNTEEEITEPKKQEEKKEEEVKDKEIDKEEDGENRQNLEDGQDGREEGRTDVSENNGRDREPKPSRMSMRFGGKGNTGFMNSHAKTKTVPLRNRNPFRCVFIQPSFCVRFFIPCYRVCGGSIRWRGGR
ncbi:MAG: hypothetical protein FWF84_02600, partial [Kiritimatiellaeota bacterium]|nr:hypothetical protein [Kiritimatiellota bacterium]